MTGKYRTGEQEADVNGRIPLNDLSRAIAADRGLIDDAISRVLDSGWLVLGPENEKLEADLADYLKVGAAVTVANGTDALQLALISLGVGSGDLVVTVANAGGYTSTAAQSIGAEPWFADIDQSTLLMSEQTLHESLRRAPVKPAAVVVTHLYGAMAPVERLVAICNAHQIPVVEDCAQSLGAKVDGGFAGTFGAIGTTSFYPTKNLGALGDGGAVFTNDQELAARVRQLRQYGWSSKYTREASKGRNSRMDEIQAAVVHARLAHLDDRNLQRQSIHAQLERANSSRMVNHRSNSFVAHLAVMITDERENAVRHFHQAGIATDVHYPIADHQQKHAGRDSAAPLQVTEWATRHILSLPMFPELRDDEVQRIVHSLESYGSH